MSTRNTALLSATPSVQALVDRAVDDGLSHLALTDTSALYGAVQFFNACLEAGIQPIVGMAIRVQPLERKSGPEAMATGPG